MECGKNPVVVVVNPVVVVVVVLVPLALSSLGENTALLREVGKIPTMRISIIVF